MKKLLFSIIIVSFVGIAIFGFMAMDMRDGHNGCLATAANGSTCPLQTGLLGMAAFHMDALRTFSLAIFGVSILGLLLLAVALTSASASILDKHRLELRGFIVKIEETLIPRPNAGLFNWLAFHENSPALAFGRR